MTVPVLDMLWFHNVLLFSNQKVASLILSSKMKNCTLVLILCQAVFLNDSCIFAELEFLERLQQEFQLLFTRLDKIGKNLLITI